MLEVATAFVTSDSSIIHIHRHNPSKGSSLKSLQLGWPPAFFVNEQVYMYLVLPRNVEVSVTKPFQRFTAVAHHNFHRWQCPGCSHRCLMNFPC